MFTPAEIYNRLEKKWKPVSLYSAYRSPHADGVIVVILDDDNGEPYHRLTTLMVDYWDDIRFPKTETTK